MWADRACVQSPGAPEQGHPWSLHASLQKQSYKYQLLPYRDGNLPQEVTGKEKFCSSLFPQDFTLQENSYRDILFPVSGFALCFFPIHVVVDPVLTAGSGEIRQQLTVTLKICWFLEQRSKLVGLFNFFFPEELLENKDTAQKICASKNIPCRQLQQLQTNHPNCWHPRNIWCVFFAQFWI